MTHPELLYLLHLAHLTRRLIEAAERDGEEFHVADGFVPLAGGLEAQAQIRKINPTDPAPHLILRLRHLARVVVPEAGVRASAQAFFEGPFQTLPQAVDEGGWRVYVYFSPDVPRPVTLPTVDPTPPASV